MLLGQSLAMTASKNSAKAAFRYLAKSMNFRDAYSYINRYSYFLQNEIQHNKRVLVYMSNCPHMAYTFFALSNTKNVAVFVDPTLPEQKVVDKIKDLNIDAIIVSDDYVKPVKDLVQNNRLSLPIIQCETRRWGEYDTTYRLPVGMSAAESDPVAIFSTSGTTGKPKYVAYTHAMINQACLALRGLYRASGVDNFFTYGASLSHPFYFMHGLVFPLMSGCGVVICDQTAPEELVKELLEGRATRTLMKAQFIEDWLKSFVNLNIKIPTLRSVTPEYGTMSATLEKYAIENFNELKILNFYGSTETCWAVSGRPFDEPGPFDTVGRVLPGVKVRVIDENGDDVAEKKPHKGQLLVSGNLVASKYLDDKEATKMNMRGTWFFTGDYVEIDKNDFVHFLDRMDNLCKVPPTSLVVPKNVEEKILNCPGVDQVGIVNVKDQLGKPHLTAVIVKKPGFELTTNDLMKFFEMNLSEPERPVNVAFVPELPRDSHGLCNKYRLRFDLNS